MRRTRTIRAAARLAAACLVLSASASACGGGDKGISKTDYLSRAKVVCQKGNRELKAASDDVIAKLAPGQKLSGPEIDDFVRKTVIPTIRSQVERLRAIPPPKGEKGHVDEIYKALDKGIDELEQTPTKLTVGNVFAAADALANKYGIGVCATTG